MCIFFLGLFYFVHKIHVLQIRIASINRLVTDIDVFVGGLSELPEEGSVLGPVFNCLIGKQFRDLKFGDRYWFENPGVGGFTPGKQQVCFNTGMNV